MKVKVYKHRGKAVEARVPEGQDSFGDGGGDGGSIIPALVGVGATVVGVGAAVAVVSALPTWFLCLVGAGGLYSWIAASGDR